MLESPFEVISCCRLISWLKKLEIEKKVKSLAKKGQTANSKDGWAKVFSGAFLVCS